MRPALDKAVLKRIKNYDDRLFVEWDVNLERWALKRRAEDGQVFHIFYVQNEDGSFRQLDDRVIKEIYECDIWRHFDKPGDYHRFIQEKNFRHELKEKDLRQEYMKWWHKEHKTEWKQAIENAQRGILDIPKEKETKVYSIPTLKGENHESV